MSIPPSEPDGYLPHGIWTTNEEELVARFCSDSARAHLAMPIAEVFRYAEHRGASRIIFGGSFVTTVVGPNDIDCIIVFPNQNQIPDKIDRLEIGGTRFDLFFCSEDQPELLGGIVALFRTNRAGRDVGIVDVKVNSAKRLRDIFEYPSDDLIDFLRGAYHNRHIVEVQPTPRALITVHGIRSHGEWSAEICHIASANGWIVAPFAYGYQHPTVFLSTAKRSAIIDRFRDHIFYIRDRYSADISVIAHSFGTYVVAKYLLGFDRPPVGIDTLIMTGSVLDKNLDMARFEGRACYILNEVAPNDNVVRWPSLFRGSDSLFGQSGRLGFVTPHHRLDQRRSEVFGHNNVIKRDVVVQRWMPHLEAFVGSARAR